MTQTQFTDELMLITMMMKKKKEKTGNTDKKSVIGIRKSQYSSCVT